MQKTLCALALYAAILSLPGCGAAPSTSVVPTNPAQAFSATPGTPSSFQSTTLPDHVDKLYGTALLRDSMEVQTSLGHPHPEEGGSYFIFVSSADPSLGVLVFARGVTPQQLANCPSGPMMITGSIRTLRDVEFAQRIKARHSITLCSRGLDLQYISPEQLQLPAPLPSPAVSKSPSPGLTPGNVSYPIYSVPKSSTRSPVNFV